MHSQYFEEENLKRDEHQSGDGSRKCQRLPLMPVLHNETVPETYIGKQKLKLQKWTAPMKWTTDDFAVGLVHNRCKNRIRSKELLVHSHYLKTTKPPVCFDLGWNLFNWQKVASFCLWRCQNQPSKVPLNIENVLFASSKNT